MLTFTNATVNIKDVNGFLVPYQSETISYKTEKCTITNFTGHQIVVTIKKIKTDLIMFTVVWTCGTFCTSAII